MRTRVMLAFGFGCALMLGCGAAQERMASEAAQATAEPAPGDGRKIIYTAEVDLVVEDFSTLPDRLAALSKGHKAFVAKSDYRGSSRSPRFGQWTIRVPANDYPALLEEIKQLGDVTRVHADAQDISEEYADLQSRLRNKREEETRLLGLLKDATGSLADVLAVERELMRVRGEIEQAEGRQRLLDDRVALATVILRAHEVKDYFPAESASYATRAWRALSNSATLLATTMQDLSILMVALLPWLAALGVPIAASVHFLRRRGRRPLPTAK